jgi:hypothetical protein
MAMGVDQAGHQSLPGDIDDIPGARRTGLSIHCHYPVALHDNDGIVEILTVHAVKNSCVQEGRSIHESPVPLAVLGQDLI